MFSTRRLCCTSKLCVYTSVSVKSRAQIKRERTFLIAFTPGYRVKYSGVSPSQERAGGYIIKVSATPATRVERENDTTRYSCLVLSLGGAGGVSTPCSSTSTS